MAAYALPADVRLVVAPEGDDTQDSATAASLADDELISAIAEAQARIDAALAGRYPVPFSPVPAVISGLAKDIAAYFATLTYKRGSPVPPDNPVRLRYGLAMTFLSDLAVGKAIIGTTPDSSIAVAVNVVPWADTYWPGYGFGQGVTQGG